MQGVRAICFGRFYCEVASEKYLFGSCSKSRTSQRGGTKQSRHSRDQKLLEGACFHGGFCGGFCGGFSADFAVDFCCRFFGRILLGSAGFPNSCETNLRACEISSKNSRGNSRTSSPCLWVCCCCLGVHVRPGNPTPSVLQILGVGGRNATVPMLSAACWLVTPSISLLCYQLPRCSRATPSCCA